MRKDEVDGSVLQTTLKQPAPFANLGALAGFVITIVAFVRQRSTRRHYQLLIRGGELRDDLDRYAKRLNRYGELSARECKTVLNEVRSLLQTIAKHVGWKQWWSLIRIRMILRSHWQSATREQVDAVYAEMRRIDVYLKTRIREKEVVQA